jgi:NADH dehydrogenase (ubiquinone) flavoprotein 2
MTTYFDFSSENYKRVHLVLSKYPDNYKMAAMIPLLDLAQRQHGGWLPLAAMDKVAQICEVAPVRVYEVASFYTMFHRTPVGTYFLQVCGTTPCMICGSEEIMQTIQDELGIKNGETTKDGMFSLLEVECLGACANAPMLQMNDDYYECLTPQSVKALLKACKDNKDISQQPIPMGKWGSLPMNGQVSCEGPLGKTSLDVIEPPKVDKSRFANGDVDPVSVKKHMAY